MKKIMLLIIMLFLANQVFCLGEYPCGPDINKEQCINCCNKKSPNDIDNCVKWCFEGF